MSQPKRPRRTGFTPLAVLLIIAVLILGEVVVYQNFLSPQTNFNPTPIVSPSPIPSPIITVSPTPDPTVSWKTLENEDLKFLVKYPPGWFAESLTRLQNFDPQTAPGRGYEPVNLDKGKFVILFSDISEQEKGKNQKIDSIGKLRNVILSDENTVGYFTGEPKGKIIYTNEESLSINGTEAIYLERSLSELPWPPIKEVYLLNKKSSGAIQVSLWPNSEDGKNIFMQILSTFKFLD